MRGTRPSSADTAGARRRDRGGIALPGERNYTTANRLLSPATLVKISLAHRRGFGGATVVLENVIAGGKRKESAISVAKFGGGFAMTRACSYMVGGQFPGQTEFSTPTVHSSAILYIVKDNFS